MEMQIYWYLCANLLLFISLCWCHSVDLILLIKIYVVEQNLHCKRWLMDKNIWQKKTVLPLLPDASTWSLKTSPITTAGSGNNSRHYRVVWVAALVIHTCMLAKPVMPTPPLPTHLDMTCKCQQRFWSASSVLFLILTYSVSKLTAVWEVWVAIWIKLSENAILLCSKFAAHAVNNNRLLTFGNIYLFKEKIATIIN